MDTLQVFEWTGTVLGLLGAFLLATNSRISRYGWVAFGFALGIHANGLLLQQVGFMATSLLALYRAGMLPLRKTVAI
jgi:hypothetical protein